MLLITPCSTPCRDRSSALTSLLLVSTFHDVRGRLIAAAVNRSFNFVRGGLASALLTAVLIRDSHCRCQRLDLRRAVTLQWRNVKTSFPQYLGSSSDQPIISPNDCVPSPAMSCVNPNSSTLKTFNAVTKFAFNLVLRLRDDRKLCHKMRSYRVASTPNMCVRARDMPACMFQSPTRGPLTGSQSH